MWFIKLSKEKEEILERRYEELFFEKIKKKISSAPNYIKKYFYTFCKIDEEKVKNLLLSKPDRLYGLRSELQREFFSKIDYKTLCVAQRKPKKERNDEEKKVIAQYEKRRDKIKEIFDYKIIQGEAYEIARLLDINACIYCNRQYILTISDDEKKIARPSFDHYLPQSKYPFFAVSLYNLIPSCQICNERLKLDEDLPKRCNPYLNKEDNIPFKFSFNLDENNLMPKEIVIKDLNLKFKKFKEVFRIKTVYDAHIDFEVKDLYTFATKYSDTYLQSLLEQIGLYYRLSQEDAYRILFGTELYSKNDNNRPLSKLKRDLLEELGVIPKK